MRVAGIILAAGKSARMKRDKAQIMLGEETIVDRLRRVFSERLDPVVVVGIDVPGAPNGEMIDSLIRGIRAVEGVDAAIVQPVDAPFTTATHLDLLLERCDRPRVLSCDGAPGHPVLLPSALFSRIIARPEGGLRTLLGDAEPVEADRSILADLDTMEDLVRWNVSG